MNRSEVLRAPSVGLTHTGTVRATNQDALLCRDDAGVWCVADGMGGHEAGELASQMIVEALAALSLPSALDERLDLIEDTIHQVHADIVDYARLNLDGRTMGSTVVVLALDQQIGACLWAGDSRLYRWRAGELTLLTEDHSQVNELLARGMLTPAEAVDYPDGHVITRAVGASQSIYMDAVVVVPEQGDRLLLCSDGLSGALDHSVMAELCGEVPLARLAEALIERALAAGARDNVTAVVVEIP